MVPAGTFAASAYDIRTGGKPSGLPGRGSLGASGRTVTAGTDSSTTVKASARSRARASASNWSRHHPGPDLLMQGSSRAIWSRRGPDPVYRLTVVFWHRFFPVNVSSPESVVVVRGPASAHRAWPSGWHSLVLALWFTLWITPRLDGLVCSHYFPRSGIHYSARRRLPG